MDLKVKFVLAGAGIVGSRGIGEESWAGDCGDGMGLYGALGVVVGLKGVCGKEGFEILDMDGLDCGVDHAGGSD